MNDTAGESSARVPGEAPDPAPTPPEGEPSVGGPSSGSPATGPSPSAEPTETVGSASSSEGTTTEAAPSAGTASSAAPAPTGTRPTGVRWDDRGPAPVGADDATPPSGVRAPGPGDVVPTRTSGVGPVASPGAAWPNPAFQPGQQTAPGWAPPPPPSASSSRDPARRRRVRRVVLAVVLGLVVLGLVIVALLAFLVGPRFARYDVLDRAAVERGVTDVVTRDWKRQVGGVSCPDDERVRPGTTFFCTGTVDGRPARIPVDVVDDSGTYEVGQPR